MKIKTRDDKWKSSATYYDIDTGEVIKGHKEDILKEYRVIKRDKKTNYDERTIKYTNGCRKNPEQLSIDWI